MTQLQHFPNTVIVPLINTSYPHGEISPMHIWSTTKFIHQKPGRCGSWLFSCNLTFSKTAQKQIKRRKINKSSDNKNRRKRKKKKKAWRKLQSCFMTENPNLQPHKGVFVFNTGHWHLPSPITWLAGEGKAQRQNSLQAGRLVTSQRWSQSDFSPWSRSLLLGPKWIHSPHHWLLATSVARGVLHWGQRGVPHRGQRGSALRTEGFCTEDRMVLHWGQRGSALRTKRGSALRTKRGSALRTKRGSALRTEGSALRTKPHLQQLHPHKLPWSCWSDLQPAQKPLLSHFTDCTNLLTSVVPLYRLCKQPHFCCPTLQTVQTTSPLLSHFTDYANLTSAVPLYRLCKPHCCCPTLETMQTSPLLSSAFSISLSSKQVE